MYGEYSPPGPGDLSGDGWRAPLPSLSTRRISPRSKGSARVTVVGPTDRRIHCESNLEANACLCLFAHPSVVEVIEQPPAVRYLDRKGRRRKHTFDFIAVLASGERIAVVVKPWIKAQKHGLKHLVELLAAQTPRSVATGFVLLTERDLHPARVRDAKLINAARLSPNAAADARLAEVVRDLQGASTTIGTLVARSRLKGVGFRAAIRLVASGALLRAGTGRLDYSTVVQGKAA